MNSSGWTKSSRKNSSVEQESKDSTHQKPQVSKRKMRRRKYILQLGGFSTERATKISLVFCGVSVDGDGAVDFS
jgi:hypothetical protein